MLQRNLGRRIAQLRRDANWTQVELARRAGYSVEFVSLVERGVNAPSVAGLEKLARVFGVKVRELFAFDEPTRRERR